MALQHMAERKCVHRDVAALNVLVLTHDLVKLSDFGLAKQLEKNNDYYKYYFGISDSPMPIKVIKTLNSSKFFSIVEFFQIEDSCHIN